MAQKWSGKSVASSFAHSIFYFFIHIGGIRLAYFCLYFVVFYYTLLPSVRQKARPYLSHRFPKHGRFAMFYHTWRLNLAFGKVLIDRAAIGIRGKVCMDNEAAATKSLNDLLDQGKGAIIISAHMGSWQMAMAALDALKTDRYIVYQRPPGDVDKLAHEHGKRVTKVNFIDPGGAFGGTTEIMTALQNKALVCMTADRLFGSKRGAVKVPFLGGEVYMSASAYRIAAAMGCPVVIMFFPHLGGGHFTSVMEDIFQVAEKGSNLQNYANEVERFAQAMERFCSKYSYQFFNYFNIWE